MRCKENSFLESTKETRFSLRKERQLKGTFTTWNLINVKTCVKISFRSYSCPWGLLSDVAVLQPHFPSLLKCLAVWGEWETISHETFQGAGFFNSPSWFSVVTVEVLERFHWVFLLFSFYLSLSLSYAPFSHCRGKKKKTPSPKNEKVMETWSLCFTGKRGSKSKVLAWPCCFTALSVVQGFKYRDLCLPMAP